MIQIFRSDGRKISVFKRAHIATLALFGFRGTEIAKVTGVPVSTVYRYLKK